MGVPMEIYSFKSLPKQTPFAPEWHYVFGESHITSVDYDRIAQLILEREHDIIQNSKPINSQNDDGYTGLGSDSLTSRYGTYNLLSWEDPEISKIKEAIRSNHSEFIKFFGVSEQKVYIQCWANMLRTGQAIKPHIHGTGPRTYLGGHLSVKCSDTSTIYINPVNQINDPEIFDSKNEVGKFTIFQNCIPHYTTEHKCNSERITIAFDLEYYKRHDYCIELN